VLLSIEKLIYGGDGLARTAPGLDGRSMAVFVPFVLPGEQVEAEIRQEKPGFARGNVTRLIETSPDRIEPRCPYFQRCGGCHYQHIPYERQLGFKAQILRETLQRIAKIDLKDEIRLELPEPRAASGSDGSGICRRLLQVWIARISSGARMSDQLAARQSSNRTA
jgi:23S rRNA (uracil1939-C5)-methyltransferase